MLEALQVFQEFTKEVLLRGNLIPDAHLATILRQHGVHVFETTDSDFRKLSFLELRNPFARMLRAVHQRLKSRSMYRGSGIRVFPWFSAEAHLMNRDANLSLVIQ